MEGAPDGAVPELPIDPELVVPEPIERVVVPAPIELPEPIEPEGPEDPDDPADPELPEDPMPLPEEPAEPLVDGLVVLEDPVPDPVVLASSVFLPQAPSASKQAATIPTTAVDLIFVAYM